MRRHRRTMFSATGESPDLCSYRSATKLAACESPIAAALLRLCSILYPPLRQLRCQCTSRRRRASAGFFRRSFPGVSDPCCPKAGEKTKSSFHLFFGALIGAPEGEALLMLETADGCALSLGFEDGRKSSPDKAMRAKASTTATGEGRGKTVVCAPCDVCRKRTVGSTPRGRSAIRRAAMVATGRCAEDSSGSVAIKAANLCVAASLGNRASLAASCQGSTSSRASAERTLSSFPFP